MDKLKLLDLQFVQAITNKNQNKDDKFKLTKKQRKSNLSCK